MAERVVGRRFPLVLCYHAVSDAWPDPLAVPPPFFERQLRSLLRLGFRPVAAPDVLTRRGRLLHVTFDDAYRNVLGIVPLLEQLDVQATVFACTAYAEKGKPLLIPELRKRALGFEAELATMTWHELRELSERGVEVGSHTASHLHLPQLGDDELRRELEESRERLSDELRRPCRFVAYPFGEHDERVRKTAAAVGYSAAFALRAAGGAQADPFAVPRVDVYRRDGIMRFALKSSRTYRPLTRLAHSLRGRR